MFCAWSRWFSSCEWWNSVSVSHSLTGFYHDASSCGSGWCHVSVWERIWDGTLVFKDLCLWIFDIDCPLFAKAWHTVSGKKHRRSRDAADYYFEDESSSVTKETILTQGPLAYSGPWDPFESSRKKLVTGPWVRSILLNFTFSLSINIQIIFPILQ